MGGLGPSLGFGELKLWVLLELDAPLERPQLEDAMAGVVLRFPVLGCRYRPGWWRDRWIPAPEAGPADALEVREVEDIEEATRRLVTEDHALQAGWPWRVLQLVSPRGTRLVVEVQHAVSDAAGALCAVRELGARLDDRGGSLRGGIRERGLGAVLRQLRPRVLPALLRGLALEATRPLGVPFIAVASGPEPTEAGGTPRFHERRYPITAGLKRRCDELGCTVNDLLVAAMLQLVRSRSLRGRPAVFFTVDLRRHLHDPSPRVDNLSGFDAVLLRRDEARDTRATALAVAGRTRRQRGAAIGLAGMLGGALLGWPLPIAWQRLAGPWGSRLARSLTRRGLLVTNIGVLDPYLESWGDRVRDARVVGPFLRGALAPVFTASSYRDRLSLVLDSHDGIPRDQREAIMDRLDRTLRGD